MYVPTFNPLTDPAIQQALNAFQQTVAPVASAAYGSLSLGMVYGQKLFWSKGYGLINMTDPARGAPTADTPYRVGSVTKVFTTLATLQLRDAGLLDFDEPLTHFLPEFRIRNPFDKGPGPRLSLLACHMAGLPREVPCDNVYSQGCVEPASVLLSRIANMTLTLPPGLYPSYSNLGFALLGRALEARVQGTLWEEIVKERIVRPLKMTNTGNDLQSVASTIAVGYSAINTTQPLVELGYASPAGQMYASVADLARLMALVFSGQAAPGIETFDALQPQTVREWLHPAFTNSDGTGFGHPWELSTVAGYTLYSKSGDINGYSAFFMAEPSMKLGFIVLRSSDDSTPLTTALNAFLATVLPAFDSALRLHADPLPQPAQPDDYMGIYQLDYPSIGQLTLNVSLYPFRGQQVLAITSEPAAVAGLIAGLLEYQDGDTFKLTLRGLPTPCESREIGGLQYIYFQRDELGKVVSLTGPGLCWNCVYEKKA